MKASVDSKRPAPQAQGAFTVITAGGATLIPNAPLLQPTARW